jgi:hypothetical protein
VRAFWTISGRSFRTPAAALLLQLAALVAAAGSSRAEPAPDAAPPAPAVTLDRLLQLPADADYAAERRGGATRGEWRARFEAAERDLAAARSALKKAQEELDEVAGTADAWQVGPPVPGVAANTEAPLDYRLRQEIRRQRDEVERLERSLRDLEVEANLAAVPPEWRR